MGGRGGGGCGADRCAPLMSLLQNLLLLKGKGVVEVRGMVRREKS